jgi:hypothetical protein
LAPTTRPNGLPIDMPVTWQARWAWIPRILSVASFLATDGMVAPVRWESSAEKAARRHTQLLEQQNELLAALAEESQPDEVSYFEQQAQELAATDVATKDIADPMLRSGLSICAVAEGQCALIDPSLVRHGWAIRQCPPPGQTRSQGTEEYSRCLPRRCRPWASAAPVASMRAAGQPWSRDRFAIAACVILEAGLRV